MTTLTAPERSLRGNRNFSLFWSGEAISLLGNATTAILLPLLAVVSFDAGPLWMGLLTAAGWLPWLVIGLPAGAWTDARSPRTVMIASDLIAAAALASVPVAALFGALTLAHLVVVALLNGCCTVFFRAAYPTLIGRVVTEDQREPAFARLFGTESAMQIAGPGLGGLLAQVASALWGLVLDVVSFLVSAACLARVRLLPRDEPEPAVKESLGRRIAEGVRFTASDRLLTFLAFLGGTSNFGLTGCNTLMVLFLVRELDVSPGGVGVVMALGMCGGFLGAALAPRVSRKFGSARASTWLQVLCGPPALLYALASPGAGVALVVAGLAGVGIPVVANNVIRNAWRTTYVPERMLARQMATMQIINFGTMPLAALAAGWLGEHIGLRETLALMAAIHVLASLSMLCSPVRGLRELPAPGEMRRHSHG